VVLQSPRLRRRLAPACDRGRVIAGHRLGGLLAALALAASLVLTGVATVQAAEAAAPAEQGACHPWITWDQAWRCVGAETWVAGTAVRVTQPNTRGNPTFIDLGRPFPDPARFTIVIWGDDLWKFPNPYLLPDRNVCVYGLIELFRGVPQIIAREREQIYICE
jgi:hypothetical protein